MLTCFQIDGEELTFDVTQFKPSNLTSNLISETTKFILMKDPIYRKPKELDKLKVFPPRRHFKDSGEIFKKS